MIEKNSISAGSSLRVRRAVFPKPLASFLLAAALLIVMFSIFGYYPAGKFTVISSDLSGQYAPDLLAYKNKLADGGNLFYSSMISMGKNTFGLFAYYLSSPLNLITFLFRAASISEAILTLIIIKLSLASALMTLFLRNRYATEAGFTVIFGVMYAMCSYAIVFMINIMWLDGFFLLPFLLFLIERLLARRKGYLSLVLTLTLLFVSGFYIAYMVGIFSFFYLLKRQIENREFTPEQRKASAGMIVRYIGCAILAACLSAAVLLPAGLDILRNPDYTRTSSGFSANFTFLSFLNQLLAGSFDSMANNLPLVYCGLAAMFLTLLYFLNRAIEIRKKILAGCAIVLLILSFSISPLNLAWHLFDEPNWFKFRYSFLLCFVLISVAYSSLTQIRSLRRRDFLLVGTVFVAILLVVQGFGDMRQEGARFYANLFIGLAELFLLYTMTGIRFPENIANLKKLVPGFLAVLLALEAVLVNPLFLRPKVFGGELEWEPLHQSILSAAPLVEDAKENAQSDGILFSRMETVGGKNALDPIAAALYLDFNGTSTFNSAANKNLNRFLKQFGYYTNYNYFSSMHMYSSAVTDSLFGIRYLLDTDGLTYGYEPIAESEDGSVRLLKNPDALPLLYTAAPDASDFDAYVSEKEPDGKDPFAFQNAYLQALFGKSAFGQPVYTKIDVPAPEIYNAIVSSPGDPYTHEPKDPESKSRDTDSNRLPAEDTDRLGEEPTDATDLYETKYYRVSDKDSMQITYTITAANEDPMYFSVVSAGLCSEANVFVDGKFIASLSDSFYTTVFGIGERKAGETVQVTLRSDADTFGAIDTVFYSCDTKLFNRQLTAAHPSEGVTLDTASDGFVRATVVAEEDRLLMTSIPYETGWTLLVDGVPTDIVPFQNTFISVPLTEGTHTVELSFHAPGFVPGLAVSGAGLAVLLLCALTGSLRTYRSKKETNGKHKEE